MAITDLSTIIPQVLSLTPLVKDCWEYWTEMTAYLNTYRPKSDPIRMDNDDELNNCLVYASYQIPRLLFIVHKVWFKSRQDSCKNREFVYNNTKQKQ
jgi:hypothetical protein